MFECTVKRLDGACCLILTGELDLASVRTFLAHIDGAMQANGAIILDLANLRYLDSSGINVFLDTHRVLAKESRRMALVGPSKNVQWILGVLRLQELMPVFPTVEEALRHIGAKESRE